MNILVTGAGMKNKGAQSLTYIITGELRKKYPSDNIILMFPDEDKEFDYSNYQFSPQVCRIKSMYYLAGGIKKMMSLIKKTDHKDAAQLKEMFRDARMLIDISGYALSSVWGAYVTRFYLTAIQCAHKFRVPIYIMPQSFGPFDYNFPQSLFMNHQIRKIMKYPKVVYAREKAGFEALKKYHLKNVQLSPDLVLLTKEIAPEHIFVAPPDITIPQVSSNSVAVIPNVRLLDKCDKSELLLKYQAVIEQLLSCDKTVYVMHHSGEDKGWAKEIAAMFTNNKSVITPEWDLSCIEYEQLIKRFDYIVASRFHSIVHALKQGIPAIAIGWADKYEELLAIFDQNKYVVDVRNGLNDDTISDLITQMTENYKKESKIITERLQEVQKNDILDFLH